MAQLLRGISLSQYAGVTAALAEGLELGDVLAQEEIDAAAWPDASRAWSEAIVGAPDLQIELVKARRIAEDCLARRVAPLDADPAAWCGLLGALAVADDPGAVTSALGLSMSDVARLGRAWKRKMEADTELAKHIVEIAPTAKPPASVEAAPRALKPFPWTPAKKGQVVPAADEARLGEPRRSLGVTRPPNAPPPRRELASFQLPKSAPEVREVASPPAPPLAPPSAPPLAPPSAPSLAPLRAPAPVPPLAPVAPTPPPAPPGQMTAWAPSEVPTKAATPFEALEPGALGVSLLRYVELLVELQAPNADAVAVLASFGLDEAKKRAVEAHYDKKFAREARWATEFGRLMTQAQKALREQRAAEAKPVGSGTALAPLPLGEAARPVPPAPPAPTVPPRTHAPELSLDQYAWVTATLRKAPPDKLAEVLHRLRLTPEARDELDARWRERVASEPGLRAALGAAIQKHLQGIVEPAAKRLAGTALAPESPVGPATPFEGGRRPK